MIKRVKLVLKWLFNLPFWPKKLEQIEKNWETLKNIEKHWETLRYWKHWAIFQYIDSETLNSIQCQCWKLKHWKPTQCQCRWRFFQCFNVSLNVKCQFADHNTWQYFEGPVWHDRRLGWAERLEVFLWSTRREQNGWLERPFHVYRRWPTDENLVKFMQFIILTVMFFSAHKDLGIVYKCYHFDSFWLPSSSRFLELMFMNYC